MPLLLIGGLVLLAVACVLLVLIRWGMNWGATPDEIAATLTGDSWIDGSHGTTLRMTRAIDIEVPAAMVWPWLAQLGRGAGWYSWDLLDNGGRGSARHLISWIPEPRLGDATAVGFLRHLEPRREIVWWLDETPFLAATVRSVMAYRVVPRRGGDASRLVLRIQADARGLGSPLVRLAFPVIDSIMACRQLRNLKQRAEWYGNRAEDPARPETGIRDQYQQYETLFARGGRAGVAGKEKAAWHRRMALEQGFLDLAPRSDSPKMEDMPGRATAPNLRPSGTNRSGEH
jgi:hypothetical protein